MCECVFLAAARGYLLISHARARVWPRPNAQATAPFSPLAGSNYSYCLRFFSLRSCGLLLRRSFYLSSIWHRIASHRFIVSFPFQCELNCPIALGHCLSIIMLSVICFHAPLQALSISQHKKQGRSRVCACLKGCVLRTTGIMIQLNFNQKSMNCQQHAHTHKHTLSFSLSLSLTHSHYPV